MLIGTTIKETISSFSKNTQDRGITYSASANSRSSKAAPSRTESIGRIIVSTAMIAIACYLLFLDSKSQAALGILGTVGGYWLK